MRKRRDCQCATRINGPACCATCFGNESGGGRPRPLWGELEQPRPAPPPDRHLRPSSAVRPGESHRPPAPRRRAGPRLRPPCSRNRIPRQRGAPRGVRPPPRGAATAASRRGPRCRAAGGGAAARRMAGRRRVGGEGGAAAFRLRPGGLFPPDSGREHREARRRQRSPHGGGVMLARRLRRLLQPRGRSKGAAGGVVGVGGEHPLASRTAALLCRGPHPAGARPAATGKGYGAPPAASPARRHGAGTRPRRSPQGGPGELGAEAEPDEAILTGEGWQGCAARGAAVDGATSPSVPAFSGPCRFSRAFPLTAGLFRLPVLAQRCPPPRPSCSHPPARGRRARCLGSPPHGSASLGCPRTPPPPPGALLGLRATICTGECTPPHVPVRPVSSQGEALPPCSTSPFSGLRRLRGPTRGRSSCWAEPPRRGSPALQKRRSGLACSLASFLLHPSPFISRDLWSGRAAAPILSGSDAAMGQKSGLTRWPELLLAPALTACLPVGRIKRWCMWPLPASTYAFLLSSCLLRTACQRKLRQFGNAPSWKPSWLLYRLRFWFAWTDNNHCSKAFFHRVEE